MSANGGITIGKSHKEGGIPMVVKSTGQHVELEGGELVTNKTNSADPTKFEFEGKQLTTCEITSILNSRNNKGVKIDCDSIVGKKYEYKEGGKIHSKEKINHPTNSKIKSKLKKDFNVSFKPKNIFYPKQSLGLKRNEMPQIRSKFLPILFEQLDSDRIRYKDIRVDANTLKPSQNEINIDTANKFSLDAPYLKRTFVSSDNYIIDGHHRWYFCLINDLPIDITKIDLPIEDALNYIRQLDFIELKEIAKGGMINNSQKTLFDEGGKIEVNKYTKEIPNSIYQGVISDYDKDGISNADDLEPNKKSDIKLEEISLKDELIDIIKYRNLFVKVQKDVLDKIGEINTCGKIQCTIKTRIKTPYSIINKLRRRSLTNVKTLDKLDKKAKEFLKNKNLKGIDLYKGLTDILGFMVVVEDFDSLTKLKNEIEQGKLGEVLEFEDFYANDNNGYRAYHFLLSTEFEGTFIPYELQIRTARVNKLAGITHTIYKQGKLNGEFNNKLSKQIELADKGNKVIARLVDAELEDKNLSDKLTIEKFALGDVVMGKWVSSYKYKVRNNANKRISYVTIFAENELKARKEINKKYKDFTILSISINERNYVPIDEFVDNEIYRSQVDLFDTHKERDSLIADEGIFKYGGGINNAEINSNCNCSKCLSNKKTLILDEADTQNGGKIFLVKLENLFYVINDDEIVSRSSDLKDAKKEFELALYKDKVNSKKKFVGGGAITDSELQGIKKIVPKNMLLSINENLKEREIAIKNGQDVENFDYFENLIEGYREIPKLYYQDEKGKNAIVYLHYFSGGSDWYITELDKENNEGFGYVVLNGDTQNSEFGYINMDELANSKIDLDLYWSFKTLNEIFDKKYPELVDGEIEYFDKESKLTRLTDYEIIIEKNDFKNQFEVNQLIESMIDEKGMDNNMYTTIEQSFLQRYSGMGGLQKFGAKGKGILWEYYTPKNVANVMWQLAYKYKSVSKFERVLENSVGVGTFVNTCPLQVGSMDCYDISKYAIAICTILYGKDERFTFLHKSFETKFFDGNTSVKGNVTPIYDLVIGNPPYSEYSGKYAGMGEKKYTKAENYIDYFIFRSLDLLKSGGLLVYILGSVKGMGQDNWLESKDNYTKTEIKKKADLVDALRLGSGVFEFTDVDSDIIVLRKK